MIVTEAVCGVCVLQEELLQLDRHLQDEQTSLREQQQQQERSSTSVTGQMCQESQVSLVTPISDDVNFESTCKTFIYYPDVVSCV